MKAVKEEVSILLLGTNITTGGAQQVLLDLAQSLYEKNIKVTAAFFYDKDGLLKSWQKQFPFPILCFNAWHQKDSALKRVFRLIKSWFKLVGWMRREKFDKVLTFTHDSNILGLPAAYLSGVDSRYGSHHVRYPSLNKLKIKIHTFIINSRISSGLVAVSSYTKDQAIEEGIQSEKIIIIHNGIKDVSVRPEVFSNLKNEMKSYLHDPIILNVGRLVYQKGQEYFIKAAAKVLESFPDAKFLIAGEGDLRDELETLIQQLNLQSAVYLLGNRRDIPELLALSDMFVLPSRYEGLPISLLEAMSSGKAVVCSNIPGVSDVVKNGETGFLVPVENSESLSEAMIHLLSDQSLRENLGQKARDMVHTKFAISNMVANYIELFEGCYEA